MNKPEWTINDIPDLKGKIMIVTGANVGLGYESTKIFAQKNATVIMACRSKERATEARHQIEDEFPDAHLITMTLDLSSLKSVKAFSDSFKKKYQRLDVLLNNAGIMTVPYGKTEDGFELQNGVNHLGHFALTAQLFELIKNTPNSRIVNVSSIAHKQGKMDFDNYLYENGNYGKMKSYGRSKLSNLLFTYELDRRIKEKGYDVKILAAHPGTSSTELGRYLKAEASSNAFLKFALRFGQPPYKGCLPQVRASVDVNAQSGEYYGPDGLFEMKGNPVLVKSNKRSRNLMDAKLLWERSEQLTNIKFEI